MQSLRSIIKEYCAFGKPENGVYNSFYMTFKIVAPYAAENTSKLWEVWHYKKLNVFWSKINRLDEGRMMGAYLTMKEAKERCTELIKKQYKK